MRLIPLRSRRLSVLTNIASPQSRFKELLGSKKSSCYLASPTVYRSSKIKKKPRLASSSLPRPVSFQLLQLSNPVSSPPSTLLGSKPVLLRESNPVLLRESNPVLLKESNPVFSPLPTLLGSKPVLLRESNPVLLRESNPVLLKESSPVSSPPPTLLESKPIPLVESISVPFIESNPVFSPFLQLHCLALLKRSNLILSQLFKKNSPVLNLQILKTNYQAVSSKPSRRNIGLRLNTAAILLNKPPRNAERNKSNALLYNSTLLSWERGDLISLHVRKVQSCSV